VSATACHLCRLPVLAASLPWGDDEGRDPVPCHPACRLIVDAANEAAMPVEARPPGRVAGVASISFMDKSVNWTQFEPEKRAEFFPEYSRALEGILDGQGDAIRAYCARLLLPAPSVYRELPQTHAGCLLARDTAATLAAGDHLVLYNHPRNIARSAPPVAQSIALAERLADRGVTLHIASLGLDLSRPLHQHALRLAAAAADESRLTEEAQRHLVTTNDGVPETLRGIRYEDAVRNPVFRWTVAAIKSGLSPAQVSKLADHRWHAAHHCRERMFVVYAGESRDLARAAVRDNRWWCRTCDTCHDTGPNCPACGKVGTTMSAYHRRGLTMVRRDGHYSDAEPFEAEALAIWDWYCANTPDQERRPWEKKESA
jgi:rubrerythrin